MNSSNSGLRRGIVTLVELKAIKDHWFAMGTYTSYCQVGKIFLNCDRYSSNSPKFGGEPLGQTSFSIYAEIYYLLQYHQLFYMERKNNFQRFAKKLPLNLCKYLQIIGFFVVPYKLWNWIEFFSFWLFSCKDWFHSYQSYLQFEWLASNFLL